MLEGKKILAITPARGGSKGIPYKNIRQVAGKPLIEWTINKALESKLIDRYVVSTEDTEISKIAFDCGAEVIQRPIELAQDTTPTLPVLIHALNYMSPRFYPNIVVLLQATSPIRKGGLIDYCINQFVESKKDFLVTGYISKDIPFNKQAESLRRQDIEGFFCTDGNIYISKASIIRNGNFIGNSIEYIQLTEEENVDINTMFDLWLAEKVLLERYNG